MTPAEAVVLQALATADHGLVMWFITVTDPGYPGRVVAYAMQASNNGGLRLPGELVADTIEEVRAMLPPGLTWSERSGLDPVGTVEAWD